MRSIVARLSLVAALAIASLAAAAPVDAGPRSQRTARRAPPANKWFGLRKGGLIRFRENAGVKVLGGRSGVLDVQTLFGASEDSSPFVAAQLADEKGITVLATPASGEQNDGSVLYPSANRPKVFERVLRVGDHAIGEDARPLLRQTSSVRDSVLTFDLLPGANDDAASVLASRISKATGKLVELRRPGTPYPREFRPDGPIWIPLGHK